MSAKLVLTHGNPEKILQPVTSKYSAFIFLSYFNNKYFLEHHTFGNVTKCHFWKCNKISCITLIWTIYIWFNSYINSQTSVELTADKMQNFLAKQEPGAYNTDLHEL